jgi:hypothetical protein
LLRAIPLLVALAVPVSSAFAESRYVEIWNPPEARLAPMGKAARKGGSQKHASRKPAARIAKVGDPARNNAPSASKTGSSIRQPKPASPVEIPRIIGPDGNPMRVSYRITA